MSAVDADSATDTAHSSGFGPGTNVPALTR